MNIAIFQDITTEQALSQLEKDGLKYNGLYVDMDNKEERKYVKDNAALITGLLKKLDRARIDKSRDYKNSVEAEAADIKHRLEEANKPFTLLIDEHKEKRAKILADKKAIEDAKALAIQIEQDHEQAVMEYKIFVIEQAEREREQAEREDRIAQEARERAEREAAQAVEQARMDKLAAEQAARDSEERAKINEQARLESIRQAEESARLAAIKAKEDTKQAAIDAEIKAKRDAEEAVKREQERVERERLAKQQEQERRERNTKHKGQINRAAVEAIMACSDVTKKQAQDIVKGIVKSEIPAVSISY